MKFTYEYVYFFLPIMRKYYDWGEFEFSTHCIIIYL